MTVVEFLIPFSCHYVTSAAASIDLDVTFRQLKTRRCTDLPKAVHIVALHLLQLLFAKVGQLRIPFYVQ